MSETERQETIGERTKVGFPEASTPEEKRGFNFAGLFIFLLVLILLGGGIWFMFFRDNSTETTAEESPTPIVEETVIETPTSVGLNKESVKIQILNGSGIPGLAGKLQAELESAGYTGIETGNADSYTYKTTLVAFDDSISEGVNSDITNILEKLYGSLDTKTNSSTKYNIVITIGYPKGFTPSPVAKSTITPSPKPTGNLSGTLTPTRSPSATLTPTP